MATTPKPSPKRRQRVLPPGTYVSAYEGPDGSLAVQRDLAAFGELKEKQFHSGNSRALIQTIFWYSQARRPIPDWAVAAISKAYMQIASGRALSWDEVFGKLHPKGRHRSALKDDYDKMFKVYLLVENSGEFIEPALFWSIGKKLGIGARRCSDLYYKQKKLIQEG